MRASERTVCHTITLSLLHRRYLTAVQGTYQFFSLALLKNPSKRHETSDDIESFLWVMLWIAIRHAPNGLTADDRLAMLSYFDFSKTKTPARAKSLWTLAGGELVTSKREGLLLTTSFFADLLERLTADFRLAWHREEKEAVERWATHDWMEDTLEDACKNDEWSAMKDGAVDHPVAQPPEAPKAVMKRFSEIESDTKPAMKRRRMHKEDS